MSMSFSEGVLALVADWDIGGPHGPYLNGASVRTPHLIHGMKTAVMTNEEIDLIFFMKDNQGYPQRNHYHRYPDQAPVMEGDVEYIKQIHRFVERHVDMNKEIE